MRSRRGALILAICALVAVCLLLFAADLTGATGGNSIASPDTAGNVGQHASLALDASGNPVVSYYDMTNGDLKVLHCGNANCSSGNSITAPDSGGDVGTWTSIVLDASGYPVVAYQDGTLGDLKLLDCGNANCTSGNTVTTADGGFSVGMFNSMALDASGNPVISYYDALTDNLNVLHCGTPTCASGNVTATPDDEDDVGLYTSLVLDASGYPVIAYTDNTNEDLKLLHCGNAYCNVANSIFTPDTTGDVGFYASIDLDASGNPVIAYADTTNQDLKLLHCGDANCTSGNTITAPDTAGSVGSHTSLALDAAGNPVVSYYDATNGNLKLLHCGSPTCTADNTISSPDTAGDVGAWTSLVLDASGNPVISYYNETNDDLKVLHCGDPDCGALKKP